MTYSELLHQVSFDEIRPYLEKYADEDYSVAWYKVHYDMLRQLVPHQDEDDDKTATISNAKLDYDWEKPRLHAHPMEGGLWETSLAKELIVNDDVDATWAEIAACCLWHTSFYGYTREQRNESFENLDFICENMTKTYRDINMIRAKRAKENVESKGIHVPSVKAMMKIPEFRNKVRKKIARARGHRLLMSHSRKWRGIRRRVIENEYWDRILYTCHVAEGCITDDRDPVRIPHEMIRQALYAHRGTVYLYESYADEGSDRAKWFYELIEKYEAFYLGFNPHVIICFGVSPDHAPTTEEMNSIKDIISSFGAGCTVTWGIKYDESLDKNMRMSFISYE